MEHLGHATAPKISRLGHARCLGEVDAHITCAARQVEHARADREGEVAMARLRQRTSSRNEMMRLSRSYFGAIASNMSRTAETFSSPSGSSSVSQRRVDEEVTESGYEGCRSVVSPGGLGTTQPLSRRLQCPAAAEASSWARRWPCR